MARTSDEPPPPKGMGRPICGVCGYRLSGLVYDEDRRVECPECGARQTPSAMRPMGRLHPFLIWPASLTLLSLLPVLTQVAMGLPPLILSPCALLAMMFGFFGPIIAATIVSERFARHRRSRAFVLIVLFGGWAICGAMTAATVYALGRLI
jgi:hypothetical protein